MDVYNHLSKVDEFLPLAKRERYMFTFRGKKHSSLARQDSTLSSSVLSNSSQTPL